MHSLELISDEGDTLSVFIDDENPDVVQGGLLDVYKRQPLLRYLN